MISYELGMYLIIKKILQVPDINNPNFGISYNTFHDSKPIHWQNSSF